MKNLKAFIWAAMHSPEFDLCHIKWPLSVRYYSRSTQSRSIEIMFQWPSIYLPWKVLDMYKAATDPNHKMYDEIPF